MDGGTGARFAVSSQFRRLCDPQCPGFGFIGKAVQQLFDPLLTAQRAESTEYRE
jgi:hypothetical protein